jgi:hypothetical protein
MMNKKLRFALLGGLGFLSMACALSIEDVNPVAPTVDVIAPTVAPTSTPALPEPTQFAPTAILSTPTQGATMTAQPTVAATATRQVVRVVPTVTVALPTHMLTAAPTVAAPQPVQPLISPLK